MLRKYEFADGEVRYTNRFLRSEAYADGQNGVADGQFATGTGGLRSALDWLRRWGRRSRRTTRTSTSRASTARWWH